MLQLERKASDRLAISEIFDFEKSKKLDLRGKPNFSEYWPVIGLYFAKRDENKERANILDSSTVKPVYFFTGWAVHEISITFIISSIASYIN